MSKIDSPIVSEEEFGRNTIRTKCYANAKVKKSCNKCEEKELCEKEVKAVIERLDSEYRSKHILR
jgi:hypothetical protein